MTPRAKTGMVLALAATFLLAGLLPLTLLALPNPPQYQTVEAMEERGAYLLDGEELLRLYPHPEEVDEFPAEAAAAAPDSSLLVRSRQYDELYRYELRSFAADGYEAETVDTERFLDDNRILHVVPSEELAPGTYVFESVEDSMYGDPEYYYFSVSRPSSDLSR